MGRFSTAPCAVSAIDRCRGLGLGADDSGGMWPQMSLRPGVTVENFAPGHSESHGFQNVSMDINMEPEWNVIDDPFGILMVISGWWLGHPSEKYERQFPMISNPINMGT